MKRILIHPKVRFVAGCIGLSLMITFGLPLIHHLLIPNEMDQMIEKMGLNPAELFYTDSERSGEVEFEVRFCD